LKRLVGRSSGSAHATVNTEQGAGDERGTVAGQVYGRARDLAGPSEAAERGATGEERPRLVVQCVLTSVVNGPGRMAFTRTAGANACAMATVIACSPALAAA